MGGGGGGGTACKNLIRYRRWYCLQKPESFFAPPAAVNTAYTLLRTTTPLNLVTLEPRCVGGGRTDTAAIAVVARRRSTYCQAPARPRIQ